MSLVLQSSGGGQITIQEPATASNFTQNLTAVNGNIVTTGDSGTITQAMLSTAASSIGVGQTWQSVSRASGTTYTNSTGKPIFVSLSVSITATSSLTVVVGGVTIYSKTMTTAVTAHTESFIVPNGDTYTITVTNVSAFNVRELR
jgi:hypothetical protein